jgi:chromosome segregation ATPase
VGDRGKLPGKKPAALSMLSCGEQSLTALL